VLKKLIWVILIGAFVLGLIIPITVNICASRKLDKELRVIVTDEGLARFRGSSKSDLPDSQNAVVVYRHAFKILDANRSKFAFVHEHRNKTWTVEEKAQIKAILAQYADIFPLLHEASLYQECDFNLDYGNGARILVPHLAQLRDCVTLLLVKALLDAEEGRQDQAVERIFDAFAAARSIQNDGLLTSDLYRVSFDKYILNTLQRLLANGNVSQHDYIRLINLLKQERETRIIDFHNMRSMLRFIFEGSFLKGKDVFWYLLDTDCGPSGPEKAIILYFSGWSYRPFIRLDYAYCLKTMDAVIQNTKNSYWPLKKQEKLLVNLNEEIPFTSFYCKRLISNLQYPLLQEASIDSQLGAVEVSMALYMYKVENGQYPSTLTDLTPKFVSKLPLDPFTGNSFDYHREGEGFAIAYRRFNKAKNKKEVIRLEFKQLSTAKNPSTNFTRPFYKKKGMAVKGEQ